MTEVTPDPKGKPARKRRKTAAEKDRDLLAQGQRDETKRRAEKKAAKAAAPTARAQDERLAEIRSAPRSTTPSGGESVTAKLSRLRTASQKDDLSDEGLALARRETAQLVGQLAAGSSTRDRAEKVLAAFDKRLGATDTKPEPVGENIETITMTVNMDAVDKAVAKAQKPAKAKPTTKAKLPAKVTDVKDAGEGSPASNGDVYHQVPFKAAYHGSGKAAAGECRCGIQASSTVLVQKADGGVRAQLALCDNHANAYALKYDVPVPGQTAANLATVKAQLAEKEKVA